MNFAHILKGRRGSKTWAVNTKTGEQSTGLELTSPPVWDGITVAQGRVYVSLLDGRLQCLGKYLPRTCAGLLP